MNVEHPSPEIPQGLVDKIVARRGRLHVFDDLDPTRTAMVVIDMDAGSCARQPRPTAAAIDKINLVSERLRAAGGTVAFVLSKIADPVDLGRRLGHDLAAEYHEETQRGGVGLSTFFRIFGDVRPAADVVDLINRSCTARQ